MSPCFKELLRLRSKVGCLIQREAAGDQKRLEVGNRRYRIAEWNRKLGQKKEEALLAKMADLQVEIDLFGMHGDYRRQSRRMQPGKGNGKGGYEEDTHEEEPASQEPASPTQDEGECAYASGEPGGTSSTNRALFHSPQSALGQLVRNLAQVVR